MTEPAPTTPEIPKDLQDLVQAVKALATTCNLLDQGLFPRPKQKAVEFCLDFQKELYSQAVAKAFEHPEWQSSPDLVQLKIANERIARETSSAEAMAALEKAGVAP